MNVTRSVPNGADLLISAEDRPAPIGTAGGYIAWKVS
jgi:hypothetical protein